MNIATREFRIVRCVRYPYVAMLGAIPPTVEAGIALKNAVTEVVDWHRLTVADHSPAVH